MQHTLFIPRTRCSLRGFQRARRHSRSRRQSRPRQHPWGTATWLQSKSLGTHPWKGEARDTRAPRGCLCHLGHSGIPTQPSGGATMPKAMQPPLALPRAWGRMAGLIGPDRGSWDTSKQVCTLLGTIPSGVRCTFWRRVENSSCCGGHSLSPAHQLLSRRTWHAPQCLSTPLRKGRGTQLGRAAWAAWATGSAESQSTWERVLQPARAARHAWQSSTVSSA